MDDVRRVLLGFGIPKESIEDLLKLLSRHRFERDPKLPTPGNSTPPTRSRGSITRIATREFLNCSRAILLFPPHRSHIPMLKRLFVKVGRLGFSGPNMLRRSNNFIQMHHCLSARGISIKPSRSREPTPASKRPPLRPLPRVAYEWACAASAKSPLLRVCLARSNITAVIPSNAFCVSISIA